MKNHFKLIKKLKGFVSLSLVSAVLLAGCTPEGVINKTKYNGEKVTNTCDKFKEELENIKNSNANPSQLVIADYDNSDFDYYYLDPGQWEMRDGNLNFRLAQDLEYGKYLVKGVAIQVIAKFKSQDHLASLENPNQGEIGMLVVDADYWASHKDPFMLYQIPVTKAAEGKQISLTFSVVKYKKGKVVKEFCNSVEVPLGPAEPACCTDQGWDKVGLTSIVEMPEVSIPDENYKYRGFTGSLDLIFPENSTVFDKKLLSKAIQDHINVFDSLGFKVRNVKLDGYASMGGKEEYNQKLSEKRAKAVYDDLMMSLKDSTMEVNYAGLGEDWNRLVLLTKTSALAGDEQSQVLQIAEGPGTNDEKEEAMRKLGFWNKLVEEVIVNTRHTFVTFNFDYAPDKMWVEYYPSQLPVLSEELFNIANKSMTIGKWNDGSDVRKGLKVLDILIGNNKKPNLFAMRSTYHFGDNNFRSAISDIDEALKLDKSNTSYALASLAYKTNYAGSYGMEERMDMLNMYNDYVNKYPDNKSLFFNRAVMMDKVGMIAGALAEYEELLEGADPSAKNLNNRGVAKLKTYRMTDAEADFKAAVSSDPKLAEAYYNLAIVYAVRGLTSKVTENLDNAVRLNPKLKGDIFSNEAFRVMRDTPAFDRFR